MARCLDIHSLQGLPTKNPDLSRGVCRVQRVKLYRLPLAETTAVVLPLPTEACSLMRW